MDPSLPNKPIPDEDRPDVGDIPTRPKSPAVIRFLGCDAEMAGLSTDYFTVGRTDDCDLRLPQELGGHPSIVLRFSRGAEGWRVSPSDNQAVFVNQEQIRGLTGLRSGDVIRFSPGAAGMQFNIVHQNATPLANLVAKYAPRLLADGAPSAPQRGNDSHVEGMAPLRYEAGGRDGGGESAGAAKPAGAGPSPSEEPSSKIDPAVLVAGAILLAGAMLGAAVLYTTPSVSDEATGALTNEASTSEAPPATTPPAVGPAGSADPQTPDDAPGAPPERVEEAGSPAEPPAPATPEPLLKEGQTPQPDPEPTRPIDPEELIEDPFG